MSSSPIIVLFLIAIVIALICGGIFMVVDKGKGKRMVTALSFRIGLSIALILFLIIGYLMGWIQPHPIMPR
jgi:hypothetical protein